MPPVVPSSSSSDTGNRTVKLSNGVEMPTVGFGCAGYVRKPALLEALPGELRPAAFGWSLEVCPLFAVAGGLFRIDVLRAEVLYRLFPMGQAMPYAWPEPAGVLALNACVAGAFTVTAAYNMRRGFPFSTYGEIWFCWAQTIALVGCVMHFQRTPRVRAAALALALAAWASMLLGGAVPLAAVVALQAAAPVGVALGRVPQIALNVRNGHTGQLSLGMCALNAVGTGIRIFTTLTLTGDLLLLAGYVLVFAVNGVLVAQCLQTRVKLARGEVKLDPPATGQV